MRLSRDGIPVVLHDPTLDRTTSARGPARHWLARDLATLQVGSTIGVPTLEQVLREISLPLLIELKEPESQEVVAGVLLKLDAAPRAVVAAADDGALDAFRQPPFLVGASARDILRLWVAPLRGLPAPRCMAYSVPWRHRGVLPVPTPIFIANARVLGATVHVWTVDDPGIALRLWNRGANGIVTNDPARMLAVREGKT